MLNLLNLLTGLLQLVLGKFHFQNPKSPFITDKLVFGVPGSV